LIASTLRSNARLKHCGKESILLSPSRFPGHLLLICDDSATRLHDPARGLAESRHHGPAGGSRSADRGGTWSFDEDLVLFRDVTVKEVLDKQRARKNPTSSMTLL